MQFKVQIWHLPLFVDEPPSALKHNPLAMLFADDALFSTGDDSFNGFDYFFRQVIDPPNSLCVPHKVMSGVAVEVGFMPKTSP